MKAGDSFKIIKNCQWQGSRGPFKIAEIPRLSQDGYEDKLDLGKMIVFHAKDYQGKIGEYAIPIEWIEPLKG